VEGDLRRNADFLEPIFMAKTRVQKEVALEGLNTKIEKSKGVVFAKYMGLTVNEIQELRGKLKEENSEMIVAKKRLIGLMLEKAGYEKDAAKDMDGGVAVVFGYEDEVAPAKVLADFAKEHDLVGFHGGILEGNYIDAATVTELSKLPSKAELLAKLVGSLKSPSTGFVNVLSGNLRGLVQVLNQVREQKEA